MENNLTEWGYKITQDIGFIYTLHTEEFSTVDNEYYKILRLELDSAKALTSVEKHYLESERKYCIYEKIWYIIFIYFLI
jgi:hypothetical protein